MPIELVVVGIAMPLSQDIVRDFAARDAARRIAPVDENPWRSAGILLGKKIRDHIGAIIFASLLGATLAGGGKMVLPAKHKATTQILIDPQVESRPPQTAGETQNSTLEANAAINYVESQMGVINSERVLLRVIRDQGYAAAVDTTTDDASSRRTRELVENRALLKLQKAVTVTRAERSFLVSITVADSNPENAAALANAIIKAYGEVNAIDRTAVARRSAMDLANRVDDMRKALNESQSRLQAYKLQNDLVGVNDKTIVERKVQEATDTLASAEKSEVQARARLKQLEASPNDIGAVAAFGSDPESRQLQVLIVGRAATAAEVEQLEATLGDSHPALIAAKTRLRDYNHRINLSLDGLRRSVRAQIAEAQTQVADARKRLAAVASEMSKIKEVDPPLRQLEDAVEAKRRALTELELKQRQIGEGGRVEGGGFRIVSPARTPTVDGQVFALSLWTVFGGLTGLALAIAYLAVGAIFEQGDGADAHHQADDLLLQRPVAESDQSAVIGSLPVILPRPGIRRLNVADAQAEVLKRPSSSYSREVTRIFRTLTTKVVQSEPLAVLVAGSAPQSGASTLAANLARTAAANGKRVLLIDANRTHPALGFLIATETPKTLIRLANRWRPLYRLQPFSQSLSLIPSFDDEEEICREIAQSTKFQRVDGMSGNFDLIIFDGPDATKPGDLRSLFPAVQQVLLLSSAEGEPGEELSALARRLRIPAGIRVGFIGARLFSMNKAA